MAFCDKEQQLIYSGVTCIDNKFILNYAPDAPGKFLAVYLLGLTLSESRGADNSCETIAAKMDISAEEVMAAYLYWEELGLVHITNSNPQQVVYLEVRDSASALKKVKPSKYTKFTREMQNVIQGRMMTPNEINQYLMFLESTTFEPDALIAVAKYCVELKGNDINYNYILTVARNQLQKGATSLAVVQDNLNSQQKYDEELKIVFKNLSISKSFDHADREMYHKWVTKYRFTQDVIVHVAADCKKKGMAKLDANLTEYYKKHALSIAEIDAYKAEKEHLTTLAIEINRTIGVYYQSVDSIIDEYVVGWLSRGYSDETILAIAKYCFRSGIRTLAGLASVMDKLHKNGVTTLEALDDYLQEISCVSELIKTILSKAGIERNVTNNDRTLYRTWTTDWNMPQDVICFVAEKAAGTVSPMAYINRVLADYKKKAIYTVEQARAQQSATATQSVPSKRAIIGKDLDRRVYTDEQLNSLFTVLDDSEE